MARDAREKICEAAIAVAARDGLLAMTLDNVAREAGVSKGGVMYHFHSKDELISGMLTQFGERLVQHLTRRVALDPRPEGRWARNILACAYPRPSEADGLEPIKPEIVEQFMLTALAAAVHKPGLIEPLKKLALDLRDRLVSEVDGGLDQLLVWLAIDGLFLWQFLGMIQRDDPLFEQILDALRRQTEQALKPRRERPTDASPKRRSAGGTTRKSPPKARSR